MGCRPRSMTGQRGSPLANIVAQPASPAAPAVTFIVRLFSLPFAESESMMRDV